MGDLGDLQQRSTQTTNRAVVVPLLSVNIMLNDGGNDTNLVGDETSEPKLTNETITVTNNFSSPASASASGACCFCFCREDVECFEELGCMTVLNVCCCDVCLGHKSIACLGCGVFCDYCCGFYHDDGDEIWSTRSGLKIC